MAPSFFAKHPLTPVITNHHQRLIILSIALYGMCTKVMWRLMSMSTCKLGLPEPLFSENPRMLISAWTSFFLAPIFLPRIQRTSDTLYDT